MELGWPDGGPGDVPPPASVVMTAVAGVDAPTARFLQNVAWETVQDYYGK